MVFDPLNMLFENKECQYLRHYKFQSHGWLSEDPSREKDVTSTDRKTSECTTFLSLFSRETIEKHFPVVKVITPELKVLD